jgi:adenine-specific DNA-methyltransferase
LEKEGLGGQVQMIYFDPPYGIKYGSNFQPFVNKRDVKDGKDEDLTAEPEMIKAFRDTWELGIHSYLTYMRDRLLLARELLSASGSIFVQISDENVHHVRELMDEVFGSNNFISLIMFSTTGGFSTKGLSRTGDYLIWYAKSIENLKYRQLYLDKEPGEKGASKYNMVELSNGSRRRLTFEERSNIELLLPGSRIFSTHDLRSQGATSSGSESFSFQSKEYHPGVTMHWKTTVEGLKRLANHKRIVVEGNLIRYVRYMDDFPVYPLTNIWIDTGGVQSRTDPKIYVVQTGTTTIQRCLIMATDPGDLILDITCGSGTTAYVAENWGRRWITCDTSRVAITLAKQRLMTALFDYYELAHPQEGVGSGFKYKTVPHITLKSIANNEPPMQETLYDQPFMDSKRIRVTGPFTVEAVPAPVVKAIDDIGAMYKTVAVQAADRSIARTGETLRQTQWRDELLRTGIRGKRGQYISFSRLEALPGTRCLHADGETRHDERGAASVREQASDSKESQRVVVSFGPEHAPLEQRQVELAIEEARKLVPQPKMIIFAAFQFDPEAAKDIDETNWPGMTLLKAQMNADLLTEDLKKKRASNESFWLMGQPDVKVIKIKAGEEKGKYRVEVHGFDYYNTKTGIVESGGTEQIAMWMLDTDYDGRSLFPRQVFFPIAGDKEGWTRLAKNLKAEIDEDLIEAYRGTVSLPFEHGDHKRIAVKIVDDRGIESLKIVEVR